MEFIKKRILQATTTGKTETTKVGEYVIIPDTGVTYHMKICLESVVKDIGFFDSYDPTNINNSGNTINLT